ncbi:hypothetical protein WJX72_007315 [[Myrmecia] bisecta]|uniref:Uncharacterized protein n=1 Tax=[Myrmecia] bisecta TaxID=41462 RepID=A0AAW1R746_9CHLO
MQHLSAQLVAALQRLAGRWCLRSHDYALEGVEEEDAVSTLQAYQRQIAGASGAGLQAVLANSVKEGLPCCLIVADFDGEVAAYRWKKGEADATEPPQQPSEAHLLEVLRHILAVYEAKTSKHVEAKGVVLLLQMNK